MRESKSPEAVYIIGFSMRRSVAPDKEVTLPRMGQKRRRQFRDQE